MKTLNKIVALGIMGLALSGCASSTTTAAAGSYPPTNPGSVMLYAAGATPNCSNYVSVGNVSVSTLNAMGTQRSQQRISQALQDQAASMGGTGVMNIQTSNNQQTGTAIRCLN